MQSLGLPQFSFHHYAHRLTVAIIGASVLFQIVGSLTQYYLFFNPVLTLFSLQIWRPFTAILVATSPTEVIFGSLIVYGLGSSLESAYGVKKFMLLAIGIPLLGFLLTLPIALVLPSFFIHQIYFGASSIMTTLWIVYGLRADRLGQQLNFWGIPLQGKTFALIGFGIILLNGVFNSFLSTLPAILSGGCAYLYMLKKLPLLTVWDKVESSYFSWKLKRLKAKRGIHVVSSEKDKGKGDITFH